MEAVKPGSFPDKLGCPECPRGRPRLVTRKQLETYSLAAGLRLVSWPAASSGGAYWWCDRCHNGGALFRWSRKSA